MFAETVSYFWVLEAERNIAEYWREKTPFPFALYKVIPV